MFLSWPRDKINRVTLECHTTGASLSWLSATLYLLMYMYCKLWGKMATLMLSWQIMWLQFKKGQHTFSLSFSSCFCSFLFLLFECLIFSRTSTSCRSSWVNFSFWVSMYLLSLFCFLVEETAFFWVHLSKLKVNHGTKSTEILDKLGEKCAKQCIHKK